jgi:hypothetical protein
MLEILVTFLIFCLSRIRGLWYLARGPEIIDKAYIAVCERSSLGSDTF